MKITKVSRRASLAASLIVATLASGEAAGAQDASLLKTGARVRVSSVALSMEEGGFDALTHDTLTFVARDGTRRALARRDVTRLEVANRSRTRASELAVAGTLGGAVIGAVLGAQAVERQNSTSREFPRLSSTGGGAFAGALVGAAGGGVLGAIAGRFLRTVRWESVPLDDGAAATSPCERDTCRPPPHS